MGVQTFEQTIFSDASLADIDYLELGVMQGIDLAPHCEVCFVGLVTSKMSP